MHGEVLSSRTPVAWSRSNLLTLISISPVCPSWHPTTTCFVSCITPCGPVVFVGALRDRVLVLLDRDHHEQAREQHEDDAEDAPVLGVLLPRHGGAEPDGEAERGRGHERDHTPRGGVEAEDLAGAPLGCLLYT